MRPFDSRHRIDAKGDSRARQRSRRYFGARGGLAPHRPRLAHRLPPTWRCSSTGETNNTSLALAFELIEKGRVGKVLLFPADAQVGNWLSWHGEKMKFGE